MHIRQGKGKDFSFKVLVLWRLNKNKSLKLKSMKIMHQIEISMLPLMFQHQNWLLIKISNRLSLFNNNNNSSLSTAWTL